MSPDVRTVAMGRCNASLWPPCHREQGDQEGRRSGIRHEPRGVRQVRLFMAYDPQAPSGATGQTSPEFSLRIWLGKPTLGRGWEGAQSTSSKRANALFLLSQLLNDNFFRVLRP